LSCAVWVGTGSTTDPEGLATGCSLVVVASAIDVSAGRLIVSSVVVGAMTGGTIVSEAAWVEVIPPSWVGVVSGIAVWTLGCILSRVGWVLASAAVFVGASSEAESTVAGSSVGGTLLAIGPDIVRAWLCGTFSDALDSGTMAVGTASAVVPAEDDASAAISVAVVDATSGNASAAVVEATAEVVGAASCWDVVLVSAKSPGGGATAESLGAATAETLEAVAVADSLGAGTGASLENDDAVGSWVWVTVSEAVAAVSDVVETVSTVLVGCSCVTEVGSVVTTSVAVKPSMGEVDSGVTDVTSPTETLTATAALSKPSANPGNETEHMMFFS
jgi:hypothetical protein